MPAVEAGIPMYQGWGKALREFAFPAACALLLWSPACAQQSNLQVLAPPSIAVSDSRTRDISCGYSSVSGDRVNVGALDINTVFGQRESSSTYRSFSAGTALVGGVGPERLFLGQASKDINGVTIHMSGSKHYFYGEGDYPRRMLLVSIPASFGKFTIGNNNKEEIQVYNFLAGLQGGAALNIRAGNFLATPSAVFGVMGGYRERYDGGVYYSNLNSGGVRPFGVFTLGADLAYIPGHARLSAAYQRTLSSGRDRAMDSVMFQLIIGWDLWASFKQPPHAPVSPVPAAD